MFPNTEGIKSDLNGNILNCPQEGKIKGREKTAQGKLQIKSVLRGEGWRRKRWRGLKRVHEPVRINIPENRGESEMFHYDALAYESRPPISAASPLQMSVCLNIRNSWEDRTEVVSGVVKCWVISGAGKKINQ